MQFYDMQLDVGVFFFQNLSLRALLRNVHIWKLYKSESNKKKVCRTRKGQAAAMKKGINKNYDFKSYFEKEKNKKI